jgi:hypothetical protein
MAIQNIKEIINNRGYVINPDDRKIFEEGDLQSFFGFSENDAIEFIVYDVNNNQLPQGDGSLVKYIPLTNDNINDYFLVPNGTIFQKYQLPKEYFIDIERLMGEAGYTNGIFRTQITLINKRAGSDKQFDKLWIQEISPSRTEVRLFPLKEGVTLNPELKTRYDAFVNDREFREDTIAYVIEFIENIKPTEISTFLRTKYQNVWLDNLVNEFKIQNFELFVNTIYEKFVQSCIYEFTNRISDLTNINYGKPKSTKPSVVLSKELVISLCKKILTETINYYLPRQDNRTQTNTLASFDASLDEVSDILQRSESDTVYNSKQVEIVFTQVSASAVSETQFTLDTLIKNEVGPNLGKTPVVTEDEEPKYTAIPSPTETETSTTGGGASGPTDPSQGPTGQIDNENRQNWKQEVAGGQKPRLGIQ